MKVEINTLQSIDKSKNQENGLFGIVALLLVLFNSVGIYSLLMSLNKNNKIVNKLWEPSESVLYFAAPTFAFISIIIIWIIAPRASQMKQIFKISGIICSIIYIIYMVLMGYIFALGSGMRN